MTKADKRKYNLTYVSRKKGFRISTKQRTIYMKSECISKIPMQIHLLTFQYNYVIQIVIE